MSHILKVWESRTELQIHHHYQRSEFKMQHPSQLLLWILQEHCTSEANPEVRTPTYAFFTCASTRAVHLEVVPDLSNETFIQAFRRFASRKSLPRTMISDNAMTFSAAANTIQSLIRSATVQDMLHRHGTEWKFIPKRAPWFGGWWERLIGITKSTIKKVLGRALVSYETLHTIVTEIEDVKNDRPLTYVTSDASDQEPLTPAHLLYGRRITSLPHQEDVPVPLVTTQTDVTKRALAQGHLISQFRERWRHEYLTSLRQFHQTWGDNSQTIRVGDVVQIYDESPRTQWKLGTIVELLTGNDGLTRAATLRTSSGLIKKKAHSEALPIRSSTDVFFVEGRMSRRRRRP